MKSSGQTLELYINKIQNTFFYLLILFLPTQLGKHFWPGFSSVFGIRIDYLSPTVYLTDILLVLLFFILIIHKLSSLKNIKYQISNIKSRNYYIYVLFFIFLFFGIIVAKNQGLAIMGTVKLLEFLFFGFYVAKKVNQGNIKKVVFLFATGVIFESGLSLMQYLNQGSINGLFYFFGERSFNPQTPGIANASINGELILRPYGTFPHPNVLAGYLLISVNLLILYLLNFKKQDLIQKIILFSTVPIAIFGILLSMSRISAVLLIVDLIIYLKVFLNNCKNFLKFLLVAFLAIFLVGFLSNFFPIFSRIINTSSTESSFLIREDLIGSSLIIIKNNFIIGVGLNNFLIALSAFQKIRGNNLFSYLQPVHNIYLLILSETGIIGFTFFGLFLFNTFKNFGSAKNIFGKNVMILLLSVLALGLFDHYFWTIQQGRLIFSFVLGLCWTKIK